MARILSREIRGGSRRPGSRLPGEHALTQQFSVSRATVREALRVLADEGLITTHPGVGSIVSFEGALLDHRHGWSQALTEQGTPVDTTVLNLETVRDARLAAELELERDAFLAVDRMRTLADGTHISLERSRVPCGPSWRTYPSADSWTAR
ncbi:GntR family transcriptional regulator [Streptomyces sp. M19]